jgi:ATP-dependent DNA ligase
VSPLLLKYNVFDMLTLDEWEAQKCTRNLTERKQLLSYTLLRDPLATGAASPHVIVADYKRVNGIEECAEAGDCFYKQGHEGAVLKRLSSVYVWDRTTDWLKIKPEEECDLEVVATYEGKNRLTGSLGGLIVKGTVTYKKKQYEVVTRCGGGFKDSEREEFWAKRDQIIGTVVQVRYQDVSSAIKFQIEPGKQALRFPRFERLRLDKTPAGVGLNR